MVEHTLHFFIDDERIDYDIYYKKETSDVFPDLIKISRHTFYLRTWKWVLYEHILHLHAYYHV